MPVLPFIIPIMALSIPIIAIVNRKESPIGQAIARRINGREAGGSTIAETEHLKRRIAELEDKVQTLEIEMTFMNNLLEAPSKDKSAV